LRRLEKTNETRNSHQSVANRLLPVVVLTLESHKIEKLVAIRRGVQVVTTAVVMLMALGA
jgi:hypothetical protein